MEVEGTQDQELEEIVEEQTPEAVETEETPVESEEAITEALEEGAIPEVEVSEYTPNLTYKYKDQEYQFDEKLQKIVTDKETEQFVRDLLTAQRAHADYKEVGGVREIQDKIENFSKLDTEYQAISKEIDQLGAMLAVKNSAGFEAFRNHLGIDKQMVLKWAAEEAQAMEDPRYAEEMSMRRSMEQQNLDLSYQNKMMQNNIENEQAKQTHAELDALLGSNEVAQAYDNLVGTPGSFKQAVIEHGFNMHQVSGGRTQLSIPEAVSQVQQKFQGLIANQVSGTNNQVAPNPIVKSDPERTVVIKQEGKQTIPNLQGTGATPTKKRITSLEQMRKLAKTL